VGFDAGVTVSIVGDGAADVTLLVGSVTDTQIDAQIPPLSPPHPYGYFDLQVVNPNGNELLVVSAFRFEAVSNGAGGGVWSAGSTWGDGIVPPVDTQVFIADGDTIVFDRNDLVTSVADVTIRDGGTLAFANSGSPTMIVNGNIEVEDGGRLELVGHSGSPATLKLECSIAGEHGIIVRDGGTFIGQGTPLGVTRTQVAAEVTAGSASVAVAHDTSDWQPGDMITLEPDGYEAPEETVITSVSAGVITVNPPFFRHHSIGRELVNHSRDALVTSFDTDYPGYILVEAGGVLDLDHVEASWIGAGSGALEVLGIVIKSDAEVNPINRCSIHHGSGRALYLRSVEDREPGAGLVIGDSTFYRNYISIWIFDSSNILVENSSIIGGDFFGTEGYGIYLSSYADDTVIDKTLAYGKNLYGILGGRDFTGLRVLNTTLTNNWRGFATELNGDVKNGVLVGCEITGNFDRDLLYDTGEQTRSFVLYDSTFETTSPDLGNPNHSLASLKHGGENGLVKTWGEFHLDSVGEFALNYDEQLYGPEATSPVVMRGSEHGLSGVSLSASTVTEVWHLRYDEASAHWEVWGSQSGGMQPAHGGVAYTSDNVEVSFTVDEGPAPGGGDLIIFTTRAGSDDAGVQKRLEIAPDENNLNFLVDENTVLEAIGAVAFPTLITRDGPSTGYYDFLVEGTVKLENVEFEYFDSAGITFNPSAQIHSLRRVGFDHAEYEGGDGLSSIVLQFNDVGGPVATQECRFDAPLTQGEDYNVRAELSGEIYMIDAAGSYAGEAYESESGGAVHWLPASVDTLPPVAQVTSHSDGEGVTGPFVTIEGTASDASPIVWVRMNGKLVSSGDGFATWSHVSGLSGGENAFTVSAGDIFGNVEENAFEISIFSDTPEGALFVDDDATRDSPQDGSPGRPFGSIQDGIDTAASGDVVFVYPGTYEGAVFMKDQVDLIGASPSTTTIHGTVWFSEVADFAYVPVDAQLSGFEISGATGHGIYIDIGSPLISNNVISHCTPRAIHHYLIGNPQIVNNVIVNNGMGVFSNYGGMTLRNNIISENNLAGYENFGMKLGVNHLPFIESMSISYNDIWNNQAGSYVVGGANEPLEPIPGTGSLKLNPRFVDQAAGDYHLMFTSPAIDAGDPGDDHSNEPEPNGGVINMGAYGNTPEASPTLESLSVPGIAEWGLGVETLLLLVAGTVVLRRGEPMGGSRLFDIAEGS
jgi:hypothetical protein